MNIKKLSFIYKIVLVLFALSNNVFATSADTDRKAKGGVVICSGNFTDGAGPKARWIMHNVSIHKSLTIDRMRVYTATGILAYDSSVKGPAPSFTGVAFGTVGPMQTVAFKSEDLVAAGLLPGNLPGTERPVKTIIKWSSKSGDRMVTPYVLLSRPGPGDQRHARDCRSVVYR